MSVTQYTYLFFHRVEESRNLLELAGCDLNQWRSSIKILIS